MRDNVGAIHRDDQGRPDYISVLTFEYQQEAGQWVGLCLELGTSAFAATLEQTRQELHEAVGLQLNELEHLTEVRDYLAAQHVQIFPLVPSETSAYSGFDRLVSRDYLEEQHAQSSPRGYSEIALAAGFDLAVAR